MTKILITSYEEDGDVLMVMDMCEFSGEGELLESNVEHQIGIAQRQILEGEIHSFKVERI